jgi:hypothetical protein
MFSIQESFGYFGYWFSSLLAKKTRKKEKKKLLTHVCFYNRIIVGVEYNKNNKIVIDEWN